MKSIKNFFSQIKDYPSAVIGVIIIILLVTLAIYAMIAVPYKTAISEWQDLEAWYKNPKYAAPAWMNWFTSKKQPLSFSVNTADGTMSKVVTVNEKDPNITTYDISYTFDYEYDGIPQDMILYFNSTFPSKKPNVSVQMITPDGRKLRIADIGLDSQQTFRFSQDEKLQQRLKTDDVMTGIFAAPDSPTHAVLKGNYQLVISGLTFEKNSDINVEFLQLGRVYGIAGTDMYRRDLLIPLLWGAPLLWLSV